MKFAHMADVHIGSWRDPKLRDISTIAFERAVDLCREKKVDFVLICGDLLNTALPSIDQLKVVVKKLRHLKQDKIPVYIIPGSHDFSPSGKTMLDVLEHADLCVNVVKGEAKNGKLNLSFTVDEKTGVKITGMLGRRGMLEKSYYEELEKDALEQEAGEKIFMFHSAITELKSKRYEKTDSSPISLLPKGFRYYAGGHVHERRELDKTNEGYAMMVYPGPLFPANFAELEELGGGGFYIVDEGILAFQPVQVYNVQSIYLDASGKSAEQIVFALQEEIKNKEFFQTIVTIRIEGTLEEGKPSDVDFKGIFKSLYDKGAFFVMKNTIKLVGKEFKEIRIASRSVEDLERDLVNEHLGQFPLPKIQKEKESDFISSLMKVLDVEKDEGERIAEFESRVISNVEKMTESIVRE